MSFGVIGINFQGLIKAADGFAVRLAASRGNAWTDISKGITDEFGMAVLKGDEAELSVYLNAGFQYLPSAVHVQWGLHLTKP